MKPDYTTQRQAAFKAIENMTGIKSKGMTIIETIFNGKHSLSGNNTTIFEWSFNHPAFSRSGNCIVITRKNKEVETRVGIYAGDSTREVNHSGIPSEFLTGLPVDLSQL